MEAVLDDLRAKVIRLPRAERLQLVEAIYESIHAENELPFDPAWLAEIDRRAALIDAGESTLHTWEEVKQRAHEFVENKRRG